MYYGVNGKTFQKQYKRILSDYESWSKKSHSTEYLVYPKNIGFHLALDETCFSNVELTPYSPIRQQEVLRGVLLLSLKVQSLTALLSI